MQVQTSQTRVATEYDQNVESLAKCLRDKMLVRVIHDTKAFGVLTMTTTKALTLFKPGDELLNRAESVRSLKGKLALVALEYKYNGWSKDTGLTANCAVVATFSDVKALVAKQIEPWNKLLINNADVVAIRTAPEDIVEEISPCSVRMMMHYAVLRDKLSYAIAHSSGALDGDEIPGIMFPIPMLTTHVTPQQRFLLEQSRKRLDSFIDARLRDWKQVGMGG